MRLLEKLAYNSLGVDRLTCSFIGTTAALIGAGLGAAGSVASGVLANKGAKAQADASLEASREANDLQWRMYQQNRTDLAPWTQAGGRAVSTLAGLVGPPGMGGGAPYSMPAIYNSGAKTAYDPSIPGAMRFNQIGGGGPMMSVNARSQFARPAAGNAAGGTYIDYRTGQRVGSPMGGSTNNPDSLWNNFTLADFTADPGYDFRLQEGAKALERSAAAKGSLFSGGTLKDLTRYNQDFASNEFQNAYNRFQTNRATRFNQLASLAGLGQVSAGQVANQGMNTANMIGQNTIAGMTDAANARASGYAATGNAINSGVNNALNWFLLSRLGRGGLGSLGSSGDYGGET